jgi:hypothetical protein
MRASGHGTGGLTKEQAAGSHVSDSAAIRVGDRVWAFPSRTSVRCSWSSDLWSCARHGHGVSQI